MDNSTHDSRDPVWAAAWAWVTRLHEEKQLAPHDARELAQWLAADAAHSDAYSKAGRLWQLAGFVPPVSDVEIPDAPEADD